MSNFLPSQPNAANLWRGKNPGPVELNALINLIPEAAVLFDSSRNLVLLANSALLRLTAFTQNELSGASIHTLLPDLQSSNLLTAGQEYTLNLSRRMREPLPVLAQVHSINATGAWFALVIIPLHIHQQNQSRRWERLFKGLSELCQLPQSVDLDSALVRLLQSLEFLVDSRLLAIYRLENGEDMLTRLSLYDEARIFPEKLPIEDLDQLTSPVIWTPGRRVMTEIHRIARSDNLTYLASTPLGEDEDRFGMLVCGDREKPPIEQLQMLLDLVSATAEVAFSHFHQMTRLRQESEKHQRQLTIFHGLFENAGEGVIILTPELNVAELNPAAEWILGYAAAEVLRQPVDNVLIGDRVLTPYYENARQGIPIHNLGEISLHRRNGQTFPAQIQIIPIQSENDQKTIVVFISDISEHEQIRARTQQLEQRAILGEVTAVFAHEVRNPINNISLALQVLAARFNKDDGAMDSINRMLNDCSRLSHLMESVLSFSRPVEQRFEKMELTSLLKRILDRWRPRLSAVNIIPFFQSEPELPKIKGDPRSLEQVFTNLISNAVEAMNKTGGTLAIHLTNNTAASGKPQVEVIVSDNGPGIPDEIRDQIFEPFTTTKTKGTGLGLAISRRIVAAHKGSITVNSFPGGTVFHLLFPAINGD